MRFFACCFLAFAWLTPAPALAQVNLVDPDVVPLKKDKVSPEEPKADPGLDDQPDGTLVAPKKKEPSPQPPQPPRSPAGGGLKEPVKKEGTLKESPSKPTPPPLVVKTTSDADLQIAWTKWREANASRNAAGEKAARQELLALRSLIQATNIDSWAVGLLRGAQTWEAAGDSGAAVEIAVTASELAPDLPATWFLLSRLHFSSDPSNVGRYLSALGKGLWAQMRDPRYSRAMVADGATICFIALIATSVMTMLVLLLRRGYYFLYDFHFFFPAAAARWQTSALALLLLSLPIVFRMGIAPILLACFAALTMYLSWAERVVTAVLIGLLGFIPLIGELVVERTAFAQTAAEELYRIERGGPGSESLIHHYERMAAEDKVGFAERFVLGHFHLNRGHLDQAITHLKRALALRPDDVRARIALAKVFFLQGDLENSRSLLEAVKQTAPSSTVLLDLSRVYQRRVELYGDAKAGEVDLMNSNLMAARQLDPNLPPISAEDSLPSRQAGNLRLKTLPLAESDLLALAKDEESARRVRSQLSQLVVGDVPSGVAPFFPVLIAVLLMGFGFLGKSLEAARACSRCGLPMSRRGDPDLPMGGAMCTQCVNVFAKKNVVAPAVKVRKQLEVARYASRMERATTILGLLWSGMGHVFSGLPTRGALYGFVFMATITAAVLRAGVVRAPFEGAPLLVRAVPLVVTFLLVYLLSLLALRRRKT